MFKRYTKFTLLLCVVSQIYSGDTSVPCCLFSVDITSNSNLKERFKVVLIRYQVY